ncbi:MAG: hypothetical protein ACPL28_08765, partial [bacterium]
LSVFQQIILKKMKMREKIIEMSSISAGLIGGGICLLSGYEGGCAEEGCVALAVMIGTPIAAGVGCGLGYLSSYFYSDLALTKEEVEILNSILEDYYKLKKNE